MDLCKDDFLLGTSALERFPLTGEKKLAVEVRNHGVCVTHSCLKELHFC